MADTKEKDEKKDAATRQKDLEKYNVAQHMLQNSIDETTGNIKNLTQNVGSIGGEVGKMIGQTATKSGISALTYPTASLVKKASKNIFEFPVFVSSSVPIDFATATNSLLEQVYASFVQMAISQDPVVSAADMKAGNPFKSLKSDVSRYLEYTDPNSMFYAHDACHNVITTEEAVVEFDMINVDDNMNSIIQESLDYQPLSEFDHFFQEASAAAEAKKYGNNWEKYRDQGETEKKEKQEKRNAANAHVAADMSLPQLRSDIEAQQQEIERIKSNIAERTAELEKNRKSLDKEMKAYKKSGRSTGNSSPGQNVGVSDKDYYARLKQYEDRIDKINSELDDLKNGKPLDQANRRLDTLRKDLASAQSSMQSYLRGIDRDDREVIAANDAHNRHEAQEARENAREEREKVKHKADLKAKAPQFMDETKIQKLNSMKPLMMTVSVRVMDNNNTISDMIDYVVGVKTRCRVVPADVLPDFAEYPTKTMNAVSRKTKWRAGELKLMDYLFSRKEKKQAAYDSRDPKRKWYHKLYTLAHAKGSSKVARQVTGSKNPDGLIPCATMILTKADVDMIESVNGIDLLKGSTAAKICRELFLIAMIVVDIDAQSIKILMPDAGNDYEIHSLASINKQLATLDTSNSVSREVSRMMRDR